MKDVMPIYKFLQVLQITTNKSNDLKFFQNELIFLSLSTCNGCSPLTSIIEFKVAPF